MTLPDLTVNGVGMNPGARSPFPTILKKRLGVGKTTLDIPYFAMPGVNPNFLSLDIYSPAHFDGGAVDPQKKYPVVFMIHGGGWWRGDKAKDDNGLEKARFFNSLGYVYVSANHRLAPDSPHPAQVEDIARALTWVMKNIVSHQGDPEKIHLIGHSSGAHLAALICTDERYLAFHRIPPQILRGAILLDSGAYVLSEDNLGGPKQKKLYENVFGSDPAQWVAASPIRYVLPGKTFPPMLIFATTREVSLDASLKFAATLRAAGSAAIAIEVLETDHAEINQRVGRPDDVITQLVRDFLSGKDLTSFPSSI